MFRAFYAFLISYIYADFMDLRNVHTEKEMFNRAHGTVELPSVLHFLPLSQPILRTHSGRDSASRWLTKPNV